MWIGIDDTDSRSGGCTTHVATELLHRMIGLGLRLIEFPRLVRLNPNIPYKTRGNGAIALHFGKGGGQGIKIGEIYGKEIYCWPEGDDGHEVSLDIDYDIVEAQVREVLNALSHLDDDSTQPCAVISTARPDYNLYGEALSSLLSVKGVTRYVPNGARLVSIKPEARGMIGALAALAWRPKRRTYELITYRKQERIGTERDIEEDSVIELDRRMPMTFDNYDHENRYIAIAPHSPCPVLYGVRSTAFEGLERAMDIVRSEDVDRWMIFETNQGTDDHIISTSIAGARPYMSVRIEGDVVVGPKTLRGGHVVVRLNDGTGEMDATAYEPTKGFRDVLRHLCKGDRVEVYGGVRSEPRTINIEKIRILRLERCIVKAANPTCPQCGLRMRSRGRGQGYRCRKCGYKVGEEMAQYEVRERKLREGTFYEVPVIARRHLSMPLKLMRDL